MAENHGFWRVSTFIASALRTVADTTKVVRRDRGGGSVRGMLFQSGGGAVHRRVIAADRSAIR